MKGSLSRLLLAALTVSSVYAKVNHDKTYLLPRSQGVNLAMEYPTWHRHINATREDAVGGSIQVVPFYQDSSDQDDAGKYFGVERERGGKKVIDDFVSVSVNSADEPVINPFFVFHISNYQANTDFGGAPTPLVANYDDDDTVVAQVTLRDQVLIDPESKSVGARIDYHQKLDCLLKGLFFKVNVPVVNNKTSVNARTTTGSITGFTQGKQKLAQGLTDLANLSAGAGTAQSMIDYLAGNVSNTDPVNKQDALKYAKIVSGSHSKTGVADVDLMIGYNFLREDNYQVGVSLGVLFPTGNKPDATYLFGPRVGTNHWGVGAGFDSRFRLWHSDCCELELLLVGNFRYLFQDREMRTAGSGFGQYALLDKTNAVAGDAFIPGANVLTRDFNVTPGSQFDMIANLAFTWKGFTFDLGYNLYVRAAEHVKVRSWNDATDAIYGLANPLAKADVPTNAEATNNGGPDDAPNGTNLRIAPEAITLALFNKDFLPSVKTPGQLTNKVYGAVGYSWNEWEYPVLVGVFGGYEFSDNAALQQWNVGGKVGVTF